MLQFAGMMWCLQVLGKRLGPAFKSLLPKIKDLSSEAVQEFLASGVLVVDGHTLTKEEVRFLVYILICWYFLYE